MENPARRTAVLLDPYPLWLEAIELVIAAAGVEVVAKTTEPAEAAALVDEHRPDLLVAEPRTRGPEGSALPVLREAMERVPSLKLVVLARSREPEDMAEAFEAGAIAYVVKTSHPDDITAAIRQAFDHSIFFLRRDSDRAPARVTAEETDGEIPLTKRELEILRLVAEGHSNGTLAKRLWVTEQTIKFHLSNVYRKIGVPNRTAAGQWAHEHHLVPLEKRVLHA